MPRKRRSYPAELKAKVALEARHTMPSAPAVVKRERGAGVLQSANLWSRPVTLFACTFAPSAQAEGTICEFFRKMARPAGFEPATLGLEGPLSDR